MKQKQLRSAFIVALLLVFTGTGIALAHGDRGQRGDRDDDSGHVWHYGGHDGGPVMGNFDDGYGGHVADQDWHYGGHVRDYDRAHGGPMMGYYDNGGYGGHMMDHDGNHHAGWNHHGDMMGPDYDHYGLVHHNLSRSEYRRLERAREKFYHRTHELREKMADTRHAIQREKDRVFPNRHRIKALRRELAALQAKFDQYSLAYDRAVHKARSDSARDRAYAGGWGGDHGW
jgi:hypothetical protein